MSKLIDFFDTLTTIPHKDKSELKKLVYTKNISKGTNLISAGDIPQSLGYVKKGLLRYYYLDNKGNEFTKGFFAEDNIVVSYSALLENRASYFSIEALEDTEVELVKFKTFQKGFDHTHWYLSATLALVQRAYCIKEERERQLLLFNAEERYKSFHNRFPGLDKRIKQHYIASYLGIKPESLSRIRKKMGLLT